MNIEDLTKKIEEIEERAKAKEAAALEEKRNKSFYNKGNFKMQNTENRNKAWQDLANAMIEQRALSITDQVSSAVYGTDSGTDTGRIAQIAQLWDLIKEKEPLLDRVSYFNGPNFETQIPCLEAKPAEPTEVGEGWNANDPDAFKKANVAVKKINPITHVGILPITWECARQSFVGLEERIPGLLAESFRTAMCNQLFSIIFNKDNIYGGSAAASYADTHKIETNSASAVTLADLDKLALLVLDTDIAEPVIVMNPDIYSKLATTNEVGYDFIREELVRNKTVEGIKVVLSGKAPKFYGSAAQVSTGDVAVFAGDLKNVAFGVADQVTVEPMRRLGDSNIYYQAIGAWNAIMVQPKNVYALVKKA